MDEQTNTVDASTIEIIKKAGLTESQARGYLALIEHGSLSPTDLATKTGESRTNGYMICEKLEKLGLAAKKDAKKALYTPSHPSALETLAEKRRKVLVRNEQDVKNNLSPLIDLFYTGSELPGTRTLQGIEGIKEIYADTLRNSQDIYLVRTQADVPNMGEDFFQDYRVKRATNEIETYAITPLSEIGKKHVQEGFDEQFRYHRTFIPVDAYTAPVEIDIYGDKTAFISFGETQMATIIDSPPVAEAMRQLCKLIAVSYKASTVKTINQLINEA